jgi:HD-GYP domain-containing protein (c-di-GMP phosphodiesterase class II)
VGDLVDGSGDSGSVPVRLAELVAALSLGIDLGFGQPMEHVLRQCLIALRLAERHGLGEQERSVVYYTALLVNVGCHSDAHEQAKWFGDDITLKSRKYDHELGSPRAMASTLALLGAGSSLWHRFRIGLEFALSGRRELDGMIERHAALAASLADHLGLPASVRTAVGSSYEQWDGRGWPGARAGHAIPVAARLVQLAEFVEVAHRVGGIDAAVTLAARRRGTQFDPSLADLVCADPDPILGGLDSARTWDAVIGAEPALRVALSGRELDAALLAVADFVDLKSPYTLGHARTVADVAGRAATRLDLPDLEARTLYRAALVHGLGRLGVSNAIWDKPGPLGAGEWERVRMHPYLTERMLHQSASLAPIGAVAVQHRERLDGSGYPRGVSGAAISRPARVLATAEAYQAMREPRPHRPALDAGCAARELRAEATAGRLDPGVVEAVLVVEGHRGAARPRGPGGLTSREVDVLRLLALGLSSKQIAVRLLISPKTTRNHIEHIYIKIGASNRVSAGLYATQHGLLPGP